MVSGDAVLLDVGNQAAGGQPREHLSTGRVATPEEVAQTAVLLASPRSSFTSGA